MNDFSNGLACTMAHLCSGCDQGGSSRSQIDRHRRMLLSSLDVELEHVWISDHGLRDRIDFMLEPGGARFGMFDLVHARDLKRELLDLAGCPQLSPPLEEWLQEFRRDPPRAAHRGSVRLRVAPDGRRGIWLDFSNEDIRDLLDESSWLLRQLDRGVALEAGQKRKRVVRSGDGTRPVQMVDPTFEHWFETYVQDGPLEKPIPLQATIGSFTQPGFRANRTLVQTALRHRQALAARNGRPHALVAEFGSGIGNFTLPLAFAATSVDAFENDGLALRALRANLANAGLTERVSIHESDFIQSQRILQPKAYDLVFVDPPRPGLGRFLPSIAAATGLETTNQKPDWLYVSCYPESFLRDVDALSKYGYRVDKLSIVEQFPYTRHFEIVASLSAPRST